MPTLLEQAIIDAQELRDAALKNAESTILEKYNNEVKNVVETLLEQEETQLLVIGQNTIIIFIILMEEVQVVFI